MAEAVIQDCALFSGIGAGETDTLLGCLNAKRKSYGKKDFIFHADEPPLYVGIVLSGGVNVIQEDFWGNRTILAYIEPGDMFGEAFACAGTERLPVSVTAAEASDIMLIDYRKIITVCTSACEFHTRLVSNMLRILAGKNIALTRKMEHISQRTTREKVLSFLSGQALREKSGAVSLPFGRQELADYLCVDRSALSRELAAMKKEGILDYEKNRFLLK